MKIILKALDETSTSLCRVRHSLQLASQRHWLLDSLYGRELLMLKLEQLGLDLIVPTHRGPREFDALLCHVIEVLGIGAWRKPEGLAQRLRYLRTVIRMMVDVRAGHQVACPRSD
jgi:hypothetical protein